MSENEVTVETLQAFSDAWNRHNIEDLMSFMADDCIFEAAAGEDVCGKQFKGAADVRQGFMSVWQNVPDARWENGRHFVAGDRGVSEWCFTGTAKDGKRIEVDGCDVFTFRDGKIAVKNVFRKQRS